MVRRVMRTARLVTFIGLTLAVVGCSAAVAPTATPRRSAVATPTARVEPTPTPEPARTAAEIIGSFMALAAQSDVSMRVDWTGTVSGGALDHRVQGTLDDAGADERSRIAADTSGQLAVGETARIDNAVYVRQGESPWIETDADIEYDFLQLFIGRTATVADVESGPPWTLEFLAGEVSPGLLQVAFQGAENLSIATHRFEVVVDADARPVRAEMVANVTATRGGTAVSGVAEYTWTFSDVREHVVVEAPDDVWMLFDSEEIGYRIAHPADWEVEDSATGDVFIGPGYYLEIRAGPPNEVNELSQATEDSVSLLSADFGIVGDELEHSATTLLGHPAHLIAFDTVLSGDEVRIVHAEALLPDLHVTLLLVELGGTTASTEPLMRQLMSTFSLAP